MTMTKKQINAVEKATANINNKEVTTTMLADYYNSQLVDLPADSKKVPVKRFADRKSAVRRVTEVVELIVIEYGSAPVIGEGAEPAAAPKKPKTETPDAPAAKGSNSAGIAKSWENPEIAAKRAQRSAVEVDGVQYGSVNKAYKALELDTKDLIQFRMLLKETGSQKDADGRKWKIIPLNY